MGIGFPNVPRPRLSDYLIALAFVVGLVAAVLAINAIAMNMGW